MSEPTTRVLFTPERFVERQTHTGCLSSTPNETRISSRKSSWVAKRLAGDKLAASTRNEVLVEKLVIVKRVGVRALERAVRGRAACAS